MTTRAGLIGLGSGLAASVVLAYPCYILWIPGMVGGLLVTALLLVLAGRWAAGWCGAATLRERVGVGMLAGGVAAVVLFCSLGAATAHEMISPSFTSIWSKALYLMPLAEWTYGLFGGLLLIGMALSGAGGCRPLRTRLPEIENPQMALNVSLTALPAAAVAIGGTIVAMRWWAEIAFEPDVAWMVAPQRIMILPLMIGWLFFLGAQTGLWRVTQHEARRVTHRCGLDEVRMAAFVGIFTLPALLLFLGMIRADLLFSVRLRLVRIPWPFVGVMVVGVIGSLGLGALQLRVLLREILPRRSAFPPPAEGKRALLFGTIAEARLSQLALLCLGCGFAIGVPLYVTAGALLVSMLGTGDLFALQAAVGLGSSLAAGGVLTLLYFFYWGLGRAVHTRGLG